MVGAVETCRRCTYADIQVVAVHLCSPVPMIPPLIRVLTRRRRAKILVKNKVLLSPVWSGGRGGGGRVLTPVGCRYKCP